jgi:hypothetical protein
VRAGSPTGRASTAGLSILDEPEPRHDLTQRRSPDRQQTRKMAKVEKPLEFRHFCPRQL